MAGGAIEAVDQVRLRERAALDCQRNQELLVVRGELAAWSVDRRLVPETARQWTDTKKTPDSIPKICPTSDISDVIDEEVVWGGFMARHYGHFLTESVARLWAVLPDAELRGRRVVYSGSHSLDFALEWLDAGRFRMVELPPNGAVRFTNIAIPEPALRMAAWAAPEMRDIHLHVRRSMQLGCQPRDGAVWLSRSALGPGKAAYDEQLCEWLLKDHLTILHPETLTLREQLCQIESSHLVVGVLGSAMHTMLMVEDVPNYVALCGSAVPSTYVSQDALLNGKGKFVQALAHVAVREERGARFLQGMRLLIPETLRALHELGISQLGEDESIAFLLRPERLWSTVSYSSEERDAMVSVARVLSDPNSISARMRLGRMLEERGFLHVALEQFRFVADFAPDFVPASLGVAKLLAKEGQYERASVFARRALEAGPTASEAVVARNYLQS